TRPKPRAERPNQFWGIDMTKIKMATWGWLYLVVVLDWYTKEIVGYSLGIQSKTDDWLLALNRAVNSRFPKGIKDSLKEQIYLISDNGCQPTSERFMQSCSILGLKQIFTTWNNPKGNSDTERVMRTIKEDIVCICRRRALKAEGPIKSNKMGGKLVDFFQSHFW
ncbi:transposase family protein, partial [Candidatus Woesearchaeota archaeon]|nr:transposase family protein [Candidatus Woesearchaeota archaeon]